MIRRLYRLLLHLHPAPFRRRFSEEMLWIFDQESGFRRRGWLLRDGGLSIARQWLALLGTRRRQSAPRTADQGAPVFYTFEDSGPNAGALAHGAWVSAAAFAFAALLIAHGGTSGTLKLPMVVIAPDEAAPSDIAAAAPAFGGEELDRGYSMPLRQSPDRRDPAPAVGLGREPAVSRPTSEASGAQRRIRSVRTSRPLPPAILILTLLDRDRDGRLSEAERTAAGSKPFRELLDHADRDADGVITLEELEELEELEAAALSLR